MLVRVKGGRRWKLEQERRKREGHVISGGQGQGYVVMMMVRVIEHGEG
jgi:hypothetical protein